MAVIGNREVLFRGSPVQIIESVKGKIWEKEIDPGELPECEKKFLVTSSHIKLGKMSVDVYSAELPDSSFRAKEPDMEDAYFAVIHSGTDFLTPARGKEA